ncbi:uncharacterized protein LOC135471348 isoform X2 [Liolophura sinensis]|uniref:uncharacterized protein LOC135471348 isoform X2 n=1 Tax=Liolophura sinensis TaxID=3198878 RepID=UPI003157F433
MDSGKTQNSQSFVSVASKNDHDRQHHLNEKTILSPESATSELTTLLQRSRKEFYKDRKIVVRNVPPCSYEEVKEFMGDHPVSNITISKKSRHAIVTLQEGEKAIEIASALDKKHLLNTEVSVSFYPSDRLLCVAHLPSDFTESKFEALVSTYGPVEKSFLMRDEFIGESKGYGFVEYCVNREKSIPAREELDWKTVDQSTIQCDFICGNQANYNQLNSRCLLVENLPEDFRDDCHLRDIFSLFANPAYCRILVKDNETSLGIAIVEYTDHDVASQTRHHLDGSRVKGSPISISYCLVGKTAIDIYNRFISRKEASTTKGVTGSTHKSGLLPNPVFLNETLVNSPLMKSLTFRQPRLMPKLQRALKELQTGYTHQIHGTNRQGLLGPAPSMMNPLMNPNLQLGLATMLALQLHSQADLPIQANPSTSDALHLLTLLQPSMTQKGMSGTKPSLLGDPFTAQARILVQNLMSQLNGNTESQRSAGGSCDENQLSSSWEHQSSFTEGSLKNVNMNSLVNLGQIVAAIQHNRPSAPPSVPGAYSQVKPRNSLLGDASNYFGSNEANNGNRSWEKQMHQVLKSQLIGERTNTTEDCKENFLRNLQTLASQYSGSKGFMPATNANNSMAYANNSTVSNGNSLLGNYSNSTPPFHIGQNNNNTNVDHCQNNNVPAFTQNDQCVDLIGSEQGNGVHNFHHQKSALLPEPGLSNPPVYKTCQINNYTQQTASGKVHKAHPLLPAPFQTPSSTVQKPPPLLPAPFQMSGSQNIHSLVTNNTSSSTVQKPPPLLPSPFQMLRSQNCEQVNKNALVTCIQKRPPLLPTIFQGSGSQNVSSLVSNTTNSNNFSKQQPLLPDPYSNLFEQLGHHGNKTNVVDNVTKPQPLLPNPMSHSNSYNSSSLGIGSHSFQSSKMENSMKQQALLPDPVPHATPIGKKRTYSSLLPAPEVSPDGNYIGQHSQGIGGHYADSYSAKRRRNNSWQPHSLFKS